MRSHVMWMGRKALRPTTVRDEYRVCVQYGLGPGCVASPTERWRCVGPLLARLSYIQGSHRAARGGTRGRTLERLDSFKFL